MTIGPGAEAHQILLVEDEWIIAEATSRSLARLGYKTLGPALNVADAMQILDDHTPDAALVDTVLGRESALPVVDRLVAAGVPFAFLTGFTLSDLPPRFSSCRVVSKPFTEDKLRAEVEALVGG